MSGLEPLAVFSIACNVMQTITFARDAITTFNQIRDGGSVDAQLHKAVSETLKMSNDLSISIQGSNQEDAELIKVAKECSVAAEKLVKELEKFMLGVQKGPKKAIKAFGLSLKQLWKKNDIEKLEKELNRIQNIMDTRILIRTCTKFDALNLQQQNGFSTLTTSLQTFITACAKEHKDLIELVTKETGNVKDHVTSQHDNTQKEHRDHTTREHHTTRTEIISRVDDQYAANLARENRAQWIKSFDFLGRAYRISDIKAADSKPFQWLFGDVHQTGPPKPQLDVAGQAIEHDYVYKRLAEECKSKTWHRFTLWLESDERTYWIKAKAGAGKSTLMKFLSNDPRTKQLLSSNGKLPMIITHSFFLMGNGMQCNIKGFLSNLIYQIFQADKETIWIKEIISQQSESLFEDKTSCDDWSIENLEMVLRKLLVIITASCRVCLFLDGLDEVHASDGKHQLLQLLTTLGDDLPLKMCVSSRPEPEFTTNRELSVAPTLELHTLTAADMYLYALGLLSSVSKLFVENYPRQLQDFDSLKRALAETIVEKADGVFLWAHVATRSLQRGLSNGDTTNELKQRLREMPEELNQLFASMWDRLGSDKSRYRQEAALYFNLVLEWANIAVETEYSCWNPAHQPYIYSRHDGFCNGGEPRGIPLISLFQLVLAKRETFIEALGTLDFKLFEKRSLWGDCLALFDRLPVLSAGLLEFVGPLWPENQPGEIYADADIQVCFIHRTAREFFVESVEGREILRLDASNFDQRFSALVRAQICRAVASRLGPDNSRPFFLPSITIGLHNMLVAIRRGGARAGKRTFNQTVVACQVFYEHGIGVERYVRGQLDFLSIAVRSCLNNYVEDVFDKPLTYTSEYKSYLLASGIKGMHWNTPQGWLVNLEMINFLLAHGGCRSESTNISDYYSPMLYKSTGLSEFLWCISEISENTQMSVHICNSVIETLYHFARCGANFMQSLYAFSDGTSLAMSHGGRRFLDTYPEPMTGHLFVEWPIVGAMIHIVKVHSQNEDTIRDYFYHQLGEFVRSITTKEKSLDPKIIAVHRQPLGDWLQTAKLVPKDKQKLILEIITQSSIVFSNDQDSEFHSKERHKKFQQITNSILEDDAIPADISDYLLNDLGFAESWPKAVRYDLWDMQITCSTDKETLPDGVVYPPVKYVVKSS